MRLGLFGGTFNPIHHGHLRAAVEVRDAFDLAKILMIPAALPPHKNMAEVASASDRFHMVQVATEGISFLEASDIELSRSGPSYTVDTLKTFRKEFGPPASIFFILGIDAFSEITTWKSYLDLFTLADFVVMERPGLKAVSLSAFIREHISDAYEQDLTAGCFRHPQWRSIHRLPITRLDISATDIRRKLREGRSIRFLVPDQVEAMMHEKRLYV